MINGRFIRGIHLLSIRSGPHLMRAPWVSFYADSETYYDWITHCYNHEFRLLHDRWQWCWLPIRFIRPVVRAVDTIDGVPRKWRLP